MTVTLAAPVAFSPYLAISYSSIGFLEPFYFCSLIMAKIGVYDLKRASPELYIHIARSSPVLVCSALKLILGVRDALGTELIGKEKLYPNLCLILPVPCDYVHEVLPGFIRA